MKTLYLNDNWELELDEEGNIKTIEGAEALSQDLQSELKLYKGEDTFDTEKGIDWNDDILGIMGGEDYIREQISRVILDNEEVVEIIEQNITKDIENNKIEITNKINSIYGELII